jgi:hypothetical protein
MSVTDHTEGAQALHLPATSGLRPAFVIRTRATSILREPATTRPAVAVASPARTNSTICGIENPCAIRSARATVRA